MQRWAAVGIRDVVTMRAAARNCTMRRGNCGRIRGSTAYCRQPPPCPRKSQPTQRHAIAGAGGLPKVAVDRRRRRARRSLPARRARHVVASGGRDRRPAVPERDRRSSRRARRSAAACRCAFRSSPTRDRCRCTASCAVDHVGRSCESGRPATGAAHVRAASCRFPATRALWPHAFALELTVTARGSTLALASPSPTPATATFAFTTALHTYLRDRRRARDLRARPARRALSRQGSANRRRRRDRAALAIDREIDRVYRRIPAMLDVSEPRAHHRSCTRRASPTRSSGTRARKGRDDA